MSKYNWLLNTRIHLMDPEVVEGCKGWASLDNFYKGEHPYFPQFIPFLEEVMRDPERPFEKRDLSAEQPFIAELFDHSPDMLMTLVMNKLSHIVKERIRQIEEFQQNEDY
jgi:hypothetical protein